MNASSQTPPGAQRPEPSPLLEYSLCGARRPGYVLSQWPCLREPHTDAVHTDVHGVSWPATPVQAAARVIRASIEEGHGTPVEIAQAEEDAGLLFDPQRGKGIDTAAREQSAAEIRQWRDTVEDLQERLATWGLFKSKYDAVIALCAGRPDWHLMTVKEILAAADPRHVPPAGGQGAPLQLAWDRAIVGPSGDSPRENTIVPCRTSHGGPAALVLDDEQRLALGGLLLASLHAAETCTTAGCGQTETELDAYGDESTPDLWGWVLIHVQGTDGPARWWCSSWCANSAITAAGAELAEADAAAGQTEDLDARYGPGASDEYALQVAEAVEAGFEDERGYIGPEQGDDADDDTFEGKGGAW